MEMLRATFPQPDLRAWEVWRRLLTDCKWAFLSTTEESLSLLLFVNWHLWPWLIDICVDQRLVQSFMHAFVTKINECTKSKTLWSYTVMSLLSFCPYFCLNLPRFVSVKYHIRCVPSQMQLTWLGCMLSLDFAQQLCLKLRRREGRELKLGRVPKSYMWTTIHIYKTFSGEWIQTQTKWICQFPGKATAWRAVKRQPN